MAKHEPKIATPKSKKSKTAAQKAKTEANIKAAQERLARLQNQQKMVNARRATGLLGSDNAIMRLIDEEERKTETQRAKEFVESVLAGPYGEKIKKFMGKGLNGEPTKVAQIIKNYMATQGFKVAV